MVSISLMLFPPSLLSHPKKKKRGKKLTRKEETTMPKKTISIQEHILTANPPS